jgi:hypothetical protein
VHGVHGVYSVSNLGTAGCLEVLLRFPLEQAVLSSVESAQHVVVDGHTTDATIVGKHTRLWLDQLRG